VASTVRIVEKGLLAQTPHCVSVVCLSKVSPGLVLLLVLSNLKSGVCTIVETELLRTGHLPDLAAPAALKWLETALRAPLRLKLPYGSSGIFARCSSGNKALRPPRLLQATAVFRDRCPQFAVGWL
jgi:hypothetical protein